MVKFTVIEVKTQPNLKRIEEYAKRYGMTTEEALSKKRIGEDYFPIRDQQVVSVGLLNFVSEKEDSVGIMAAIYTGEEKKVLEETAKKLEKVVKATGKPFFITGDGRKYALELLAGRAMAHMIEAKRKDQEIIPEMKEMIKLLSSTKNGYLKPFDVRDSIDLQAAFGLGTDRTPAPDSLRYENKDLPALAEETKRSVLDMMTNYAAYLESQGEKIKPVVYKLNEKIFKTVEIFKFPEEEPDMEKGEINIVDIDR
jgi:hypothetical protein